MSTPTPNTPKPTKRLDLERLKVLAKESNDWPPHMRFELGVKAPSRIEPSSAILKRR